jgi:hypothetical protein
MALVFRMKHKFKILTCIGLAISAGVLVLSIHNQNRNTPSLSASLIPAAQSISFPQEDAAGNLLYKGDVLQIFFHSLVVYPKLAYQKDKKGEAYKKYMVTKDEFKKILASLYEKQYVLIDIASLYSADASGKVTPLPLYIPEGKKPLIISLDDLNYYDFMKGRGFADKLVLDKDGNVATEVVTPGGSAIVTRDGDVVPILDDFVLAHPDFSLNRAKGIIAVTGFQGILGYRTQQAASTLKTRDAEIIAAKEVVEKLKNTGWRFANHSYFHDHSYQSGDITLEAVKADTQRWKEEVGSIVGDTDIFIGPFGQEFKPNDPRRQYLVSQGYNMICGVGLDLYFHYFSDYVFMDRANVDGYRLMHNADWLNGHGISI